MPGFKSPYSDTYLTDRVLLRESVGVDASVDDPGLPVVNAHLDGSTLGATRADSEPISSGTASTYRTGARNGYNAQLALFVTLESGATAATIRVWTWGGATLPSTRAALVGKWCLVQSTDITTNALVMVRDVPASPMLVTVSAITGGGGKVSIVEQHTE